MRSWGQGAGKVYEIYRFPETASDTDYMVRFSTATIEVAESDFTLYPDYLRHHRTIKGACEFDVNVSGTHRVIDNSGSVFDFFGDTPVKCKLTTSSAFATNLIHRPQVRVKDRVLKLANLSMNVDELFTLPLVPNSDAQRLLNIVYVIEGELKLDSQQCTLTQGDTLIVNDQKLTLDTPKCTISTNMAQIYHAVIALPQAPWTAHAVPWPRP